MKDCSKLDKRTKAYKECIESEGLGDTIAKVTKTLGIDKLFANGEDCGCDKRRQTLNEKFRYKAKCLVESEYKYLNEFFKTYNEDLKKFTSEEVFKISRMHQRVFNVRTRICSNCNGAVPTMHRIIGDLKNVYETYE